MSISSTYRDCGLRWDKVQKTGKPGGGEERKPGSQEGRYHRFSFSVSWICFAITSIILSASFVAAYWGSSQHDVKQEHKNTLTSESQPYWQNRGKAETPSGSHERSQLIMASIYSTATSPHQLGTSTGGTVCYQSADRNPGTAARTTDPVNTESVCRYQCASDCAVVVQCTDHASVPCCTGRGRNSYAKYANSRHTCTACSSCQDSTSVAGIHGGRFRQPGCTRFQAAFHRRFSSECLCARQSTESAARF